MYLEVKYPIILAAVFIWIGFICAISFMESWLKFRAPGMNLQLGLSIGRIIFSALNKVEWFLALTVITTFILSKPDELITTRAIGFHMSLLILTIQSIWILPSLIERAELYNYIENIPHSSIHSQFVIAEVIKLISLIIFSLSLFKGV